MKRLPVIDQIRNGAPENLILLSDLELREVVSDNRDRYSEECRLECIAELIVRWYFNSSEEIAKIIDSIFPQKEWHYLKTIKEQYYLYGNSTTSGSQNKLWEGKTTLAIKCEKITRKRLFKLFSADGFIPVYEKDDSRAFYIPFHFDSADNHPLICDMVGKTIKNWEAPYTSLFGENPTYRCVVHCKQYDNLIEFNGHSLMLPLYLAYKRKQGELPKYNVFKLFATGAIEEKHLKSVEVKEKQQWLDANFNDAYLFFPESANNYDERANFISLSVTHRLEDILEEIKKHIEAKGLVVPTLSDAIKRLKSISYETAHSNQSNWEIMLDCLQNNMNTIEKLKCLNPEAHLLCVMLKSSIYCHMGDTEHALNYNHEAKQLARKFNLEKQLHRSEIDELVDLQDVEDFESIHSLSKALKQDIEKLNDDDLLMRYYGTMGQAHCYGYLAKKSGFERDTAKKYFDLARKHALNTNSQEDIAQDLNYTYLWYVLFDPASDDARKAYNVAKTYIEINLRDYPQSQEKNRYFLQRFKLQALYRRLLSGEKIPDIDYPAEDLPANSIFWLRALAKKYLGAIVAASGEKILAKDYFDEACKLLENDYGDSIIAFIRMTVLVEAYRSLGLESFKNNALELCSQLQPKYSVLPWENYLQHGAQYPGLNYWY